MDALRSYGGSILRGLLSSSAPSIAKGVLVEMLGEEVTYHEEKRHIDTTLIIELVNNNDSLWSLFGKKGQAKIKDTLGQLGDISWLTADWFILAVKKDYPALSSQFLGWRKAYNWLSRQAAEIRTACWNAG